MTSMTVNGPFAQMLAPEHDGVIPVRVVAWLAENYGTSGFARSLTQGFQRYGSLTPKQVLAVLRIVDEPKAEPTGDPVTEMGIYVQHDADDNGIDIYRVRESKAGNLYALLLDPTTGDFEYARGAIRNLSAADRLTSDEAALLGQALGMCIVCGATLTDPESVARGIGPVCAKKV